MRRCLILMLCLYSYPLIADSRADLLSFLDSMPAFRADFKQRVIDSDGELWQEAQGVIKIAMVNKIIRLEFSSPNRLDIVATAASVLAYNPKLQQIQQVEAHSFTELFVHPKKYLNKAKVSKKGNTFYLTLDHALGEILVQIQLDKDGLFKYIYFEDEYGTQMRMNLSSAMRIAAKQIITIGNNQ